MKKLFVCFLSVALFFCAAFGAACSGESYTYWDIVAKEAGDSRMAYVSELSFGSSTVKVAEAWINIGGLKTDSVTVKLIFSSSSTTVKTIECPVTKQQIKESKDGWVNLTSGASYSCVKVTVSVGDTMKINEIVFVSTAAKKLSATFVKGGVKNSATGNSGNVYTKEEIDKLDSSDLAYNKNPSYNIVDEQDKFPEDKIITVDSSSK